MKTLMLNQKTGMMFKDIETYVSMMKVYQNKFILFPSDIYLNYCIERGYTCGSQNIAQSDEKNQTGEVTGKQLYNIGVKYVIIGHSERRQNQNETAKILINKFNNAINNDLTIVYCIGESLVDYKLGNTEQVITSQLSDVLKNVELPDKAKLYVAYEPIWAIGTGLTPAITEIQKVASVIKEFLASLSINNFEVLYGGSVNNENIESLFEADNIDGYLIGGASNNYEKTTDICEKTINSTK